MNKSLAIFMIVAAFIAAASLAQQGVGATNDPALVEIRDAALPLKERVARFNEWAQRHYTNTADKNVDIEVYLDVAESLFLDEKNPYLQVRAQINNLLKLVGDRKDTGRMTRFADRAIAIDDIPQWALFPLVRDKYNSLIARDDLTAAEEFLVSSISTNLVWADKLHPMLAHLYVFTGRPEKCWKLYSSIEAKVKDARAIAEIAIAKADELYNTMWDEEGAKKTLADAIAKLDARKSPFAAECRLRLASLLPSAEAEKMRLDVLANTAGLEAAQDQRTFDGARMGAFACFYGDTPEHRAVRGKYFDDFRGVTFSHIAYGPLARARDNAITYGNFDFAVELTELMKKVYVDFYKNFLNALYEINALNGLARHTEAAVLAGKLLEEQPQYSDAQKFWLDVMSELPGPDFGKALKDVMKRRPLTGKFTAQERSAWLKKCGRSAMIAKRFDAAKILADTLDGLYVRQGKKAIDMQFLDKPIRGISDFRRLGLEKNMQPIERKFRVDRQFLETDVNVAGRGDNIGAEEGKKMTPASLHALADEFGVHFYFRVPADDLAAAQAKMKSLGSLEIYLAAGESCPYTCILSTVNDELFAPYNFSYGTAQHKRFPKDISELKRDEIRFEDGAVWKEMFVSWSLFPDKLPEDGDVWAFDVIHWSAAGAFSWCGVETTHARTTWGELRFDLSPSDILKMKRHVVFDALANYRRERQTTRGYNGVIGQWSDDVLGDPGFYNECLAPIVAKLDAYAKDAVPNMTDDVVERLFAEAVPQWDNIVYTVNGLRTKYVKENLVR